MIIGAQQAAALLMKAQSSGHWLASLKSLDSPSHVYSFMGGGMAKIPTQRQK